MVVAALQQFMRSTAPAPFARRLGRRAGSRLRSTAALPARRRCPRSGSRSADPRAGVISTSAVGRSSPAEVEGSPSEAE